MLRKRTPIFASLQLHRLVLISPFSIATVCVCCCRGLSCGSFYFGRRHLWFLIGTILVIVNFFFLFARCVMCDLTGDDQMNSDANLAYYAFAAAMFNVGWAAVQVSHMALVPGSTNTAAHAQLTMRGRMQLVQVLRHLHASLICCPLLVTFPSA